MTINTNKTHESNDQEHQQSPRKHNHEHQEPKKA
jgi:hypothetical protein